MIKEWHVEHEWQEPFVRALRARGATPAECNTALSAVDDECSRKGATARELFGDPSAYGKEYSVSHIATSPEAGMTPSDARASRTRAIFLAVAGLVGMFFALLGWSGMVRDVDAVWGANPTIWFVLGLIVAVAAAIGDTVLGTGADFTQGRSDSGSTVVNRLLPWIVVALTLVGMLIIKLTH